MAQKKISVKEVLIYKALLVNKGEWLKNSELETVLGEAAPRTIRKHTERFTKIGLIEKADLSPAPRYRWSEAGAKKNQRYVGRLEAMSQVLDLRSESSFRFMRPVEAPPIEAADLSH